MSPGGWLSDQLGLPIHHMTPRVLLRRFPRLFDVAKGLSRPLGNRTPLYSLLDALLPRHTPVSFIQLGAHDGLAHDPYREFILRRNFTGVLVEPLPFLFHRLVNNYRHKAAGRRWRPTGRIVFQNCAVAYPPGRFTLYTIREEALSELPDGAYLSLLACFSREQLLSHLPSPAYSDQVMPVDVPGCTVEDLMRTHAFASFDCMFLDIEGYEAQVLLSMDYSVVRPKLIAYENINLLDRAAELERHLRSKGFVLHSLPQETVAVLPAWQHH